MAEQSSGVRGVRAVAVVAVLVVVAAAVAVVRPPAAVADPSARRAERLAAVRALLPGAIGVDAGLQTVAGEDLTAAADAVTDRRDPRTAVAALALHLGRAGVAVGVSRPVGAPAGAPTDGGAADAPAYAQTEVPAEATTESADASSGYGYGYGYGLTPAVVAGDLTGDGLDDLVGVTAAPAGDVEVSATRGSDGAALWTAVVPTGGGVMGTAVQPVGDLTGDGAVDVLVSAQVTPAEDPATGPSEAPEDPCTADGCAFEVPFTWQVRLLDGATGATAWTREHAGAIAFEDRRLPGGGYRYSQETTNAVVPYAPLQDVTGDGVGDLLVTLSAEGYADERQVSGSYPGPVTETSRSGGTASTALEVVSGVDGAVEERLEEPEGDRAVAARAVPDLTGDGTTDVLLTRRGLGSTVRTCLVEGTRRTCTEEGDTGGLQVEVRRGPDLAPVWSAEYPVAAGSASSPGDLTGDGIPDVLLDAFTLSDDGLTAVLDGRDGVEVWSRLAERDVYGGGEAVLAVTPLQDDGALDLIAARYVADDRGSAHLEVVRRDGATGEVLLTTAHGLPDADEAVYTGAYVTGTSDVDGDGGADLQIVVERYGPDAVEVVTVVESGPTGAVLTTIPSAGPWPVVHVPAGDLDGDGGSDGIAFADGFSAFGPPPEGEEAVEPPPTTAVRLRDGAVLWTQPGQPDTYTSGVTPAQLDGDAGGDVVVVRERYTEALYLVQAVGIDGADGAVLWTTPPPPEVRRAAGGDRIATAVAVSASVFDGADTVVVARADDFPDALAGGPLAAALDGPLLLTGGGGLAPDTAAEVDRLGATTAVLLGGTAALSEQVAVDLAARGLAVERIGGLDRYATAAMAADRVAATSEAAIRRVAVAAGGQGAPDGGGWVDAILAAAYGAATDAPLLLVTADAVPDSTAEVLGRLAPSEGLLLVGDGTAVSAEVEAQLRDLAGVPSERLSRPTPAHTAAAVASFALRDGARPTSVWVATATRFPDALASAAAVGATRGVLLLTDGTEEADGWVLGFLGTAGAATRTITVVGGPTAVPGTTEAALRDAVAAGP